ncbi:hypothetical protein GSbR_17460 [Geobacter sp. SVR]|nr:hypothetical protein GSVR_05000 [Geobacter sp. SVR]GCF85146.1 hypothetical protein GSbR_17460 [Geobacter sp. SVR]
MDLTVVQGDTLLGVCGKYLEAKKNCHKLARINRLKNPDRIYAGQKLAIPISFLKGIPMEGRVTFIKGDAWTRENKSAEWAALHPGDHVREGNSLKTGAGSTIEITFEDGSSIFQNPDTALEYSTTRQGPLHLLRELFLLGGHTITRVKGATGKEQRFIIRTPSALASVRGTEFRLSIDGAETTRSEVMNGIMDVGAMGRDVAVRENEGTVVQKGLPPIAPRELLPPPQVILRPPFDTLPLNVGFTAISGATAYRVQLTRDRDGKDIVSEQTIEPESPFTINEIEDGAYYVRGMSIDDAGLAGMSSEPVPITVRVNPSPPLPVSPAEGAELRSDVVEMNWQTVQEAVGYHLQIATDRTFSKTVVDMAPGDARYAATVPEPGHYFYRIRSRAADGYEGAWSATRSFIVVPPPPVPSLEKPAVEGKEIRIRWHDLGAAYTYHCQVSRDSSFREVMVDRKTDGPELVIQKPEMPGTYYVRTSAIDSKGYEGNFSPPQSFEVESRFPYALLGFVPLGMLLLLLF